MSTKQTYRHRLTGLIGEFESELADVFKGVLERVTGDVPADPPAPEPVVVDEKPINPDVPGESGDADPQGKK